MVFEEGVSERLCNTVFSLLKKHLDWCFFRPDFCQGLLICYVWEDIGRYFT